MLAISCKYFNHHLIRFLFTYFAVSCVCFIIVVIIIDIFTLWIWYWTSVKYAKLQQDCSNIFYTHYSNNILTIQSLIGRHSLSRRFWLLCEVYIIKCCTRSDPLSWVHGQHLLQLRYSNFTHIWLILTKFSTNTWFPCYNNKIIKLTSMNAVPSGLTFCFSIYLARVDV